MRTTSSGPGGGGKKKKAGRRLKVAFRKNQAGLATMAGPKNAAYMQGYSRELDSSDDETGPGVAFEEQIILRLPPGTETARLRELVRTRALGDPGAPPVWFKFKDSRRAVVRVAEQLFAAKLVDLPTISETHKTMDNKNFVKSADISQMLLATHRINDESEAMAYTNSMGPTVKEDEQHIVDTLQAEVDAKAREAGFAPPVPGAGASSSSSGAQGHGQGAAAHAGFDTRDFIYPHGLTPPMAWARQRRFRHVLSKNKNGVLNEVDRLLADDDEADEVETELMDAAEAEAEIAAAAAAAAAPFEAEGDAEDASALGSEGEEVDRDLAAALDAVLDGDEDDNSDAMSATASVTASFLSGRMGGRGGSVGEVSDEDEDDDDDEMDDDLFDGASADDDGDDGEEDEGNEELHEFRARQRQLGQEIREIEALVKRRGDELERHKNPLLKQRAQTTLDKTRAELEAKRAQLAAVSEERRRARADLAAEKEEEAARAAMQAQAQTGRTEQSDEPEPHAEQDLPPGTEARGAAHATTAAPGTPHAPVPVPAASTAAPPPAGETELTPAPLQAPSGHSPAAAAAAAAAATAPAPVPAFEGMDVDRDADGEGEADGDADPDADVDAEGSEDDLFGGDDD